MNLDTISQLWKKTEDARAEGNPDKEEKAWVEFLNYSKEHPEELTEFLKLREESHKTDGRSN